MSETNYLITTVGLPRSGKSSWAREYSQEFGYPIVNPDSVRLALHKHDYIFEAEPFVWAITKCHVSSLFISGYRVVILDATNFERERRDEWQSSNWTVVFKIFNTPIDECKKRAFESNRPDLIPVIDRMDLAFDPLGADERLLDETYLGVDEVSKFDLCRKVAEQELTIESLRAQLECYK